MFAIAVLVTMASLVVLAIGTRPDGKNIQAARNAINVTAACHFFAAVLLLASTLWSSNTPASSFGFAPVLTFYVDGLSSLMLMLVGFVGWIVCRYSIRYLDGDRKQATFFRWAALVIASVSLMSISGNLLLFLIAWVATSMSLHRLLLLYSDRAEAQFAAWSKFSISRIGDGFLILGLVLVYRHFGTWQFDALFPAFQKLAAGQEPMDSSIPLMAWMFMLGAITKSAQFPFHGWLPETMETPTPVSALMHAGVVNAGGYLVIRLSPLMSLAPNALVCLTIIGLITACFGAIIMLTVTSIKRSLAYSTIAQMGFMMLQCGLGAFSAAMLHIIAHSLYKAHAFLNSGNILAESNGYKIPAQARISDRANWTSLLVGLSSVVLLVASYFAIGYGLGANPFTKPGGFVLSSILCAAIVSWLWQVSETQSKTLLFKGAFWAVGLIAIYLTGYFVVDRIIAAGIPQVALDTNRLWLAGLVLGLFALLLVSDRLVSQRNLRDWKNALYVHASNGFYIEAFMRRLAQTMKS